MRHGAVVIFSGSSALRATASLTGDRSRAITARARCAKNAACTMGHAATMHLARAAALNTRLDRGRRGKRLWKSENLTVSTRQGRRSDRSDRFPAIVAKVAGDHQLSSTRSTVHLATPMNARLWIETGISPDMTRELRLTLTHTDFHPHFRDDELSLSMLRGKVELDH